MDYGVSGIKALVPPGTYTGARWCMTFTGSANPWKINFNWSQFWTPSVGKLAHQALEVNAYTWHVLYDDDQPSAVGSVVIAPGLWVGLSEYQGTGAIGLQPDNRRTKRWLPRRWGGVDGIQSLNKLDAIFQAPITGQTIEVVLTRIGAHPLRSPNSLWGYRYRPPWVLDHTLMPGRYWEWLLRLSINGWSYRMQLLVGEAFGEALFPGEVIAHLTENWTTTENAQGRLWGHAVMQGGVWVPLRDFIVHYGPPARLAGFYAHPLGGIGISNESREYFQPGMAVNIP